MVHDSTSVAPGSVDWPPPSSRDMRRLHWALAPWRGLARPLFFGWDRVPAQGPLMFVGNHTTYGFIDLLFLYDEVYRRRGRVLRGMGDHAHFVIPVWRRLTANMGVVDGTPENCAKLMAAGEWVLVFPGGARESAKRKGERYQLFWEGHLGFARLAIANGCPVLPFAMVGVEDAFELRFDANDFLATRAGQWWARAGWRDDILHPLPGRVHPERLYFELGHPVDTRRFGGRADEDSCMALRDEVKSAVEQGIAHLRQVQAGDPERRPGPRLRRAVRRLWDGAPGNSVDSPGGAVQRRRGGGA